MVRTTLGLVALLGLLAGPPAQAQLSSQTFAGKTTGGPTWHRPETTTTLSASCTACRYSVQTFQLSFPSACNIVGVQSFDGHIALYRARADNNGGWEEFNPAAPLTDLVDLDDDGEFNVGSSRIPHDLNLASVVLDMGAYHLVTSGFNNSQQGSFVNHLVCANGQPRQGTCYSDDGPPWISVNKVVCFFERFMVKIVGVSNHPTDGFATPVRFGSQESAFFWFYDDQNFEVMIKVLNGCGVNGKWWVFAGALTNQAYHIVVVDTVNWAERHYYNTEGTNAQAITDTNAFPCP